MQGGQITGYHQNEGKVINLLDFDLIVIYFLEDAFTTGYKTKTTKTLNNNWRRFGRRRYRKRKKPYSKMEKALYKNQRETKEGNHEQQRSSQVHLQSKNQTNLQRCLSQARS